MLKKQRVDVYIDKLGLKQLLCHSWRVNGDFVEFFETELSDSLFFVAYRPVAVELVSKDLVCPYCNGTAHYFDMTGVHCSVCRPQSHSTAT